MRRILRAARLSLLASPSWSRRIRSGSTLLHPLPHQYSLRHSWEWTGHRNRQPLALHLKGTLLLRAHICRRPRHDGIVRHDRLLGIELIGSAVGDEGIVVVDLFFVGWLGRVL